MRACNYSKHGPLAPGPRPRGPMPTVPTRASREKEAVEELVGSEEGAARAKRGPVVRIIPPPESPGPGRGPPGRTPRPALRFLEPSPRHLPFRAQRLRQPWEESPPSPVSLLPRPDRPALRGALENAPNGPGTTPGPSPNRHPRSVADTASRPSPSHLKRLRRRWTQETPGSPTPALFNPLFG